MPKPITGWELRAILLAVMTALAIDARSATPAANSSLQVQVTVTIPEILTIEWGAGSNGPTPATISPYTWDLTVGGTFVVDVGETHNSDDATYNIAGNPQRFTLVNTGSRKLNVTASCSDDLVATASKWTLGTGALNTFEVWLQPEAGVYQQFLTTATAITIKNPLRRSDPPVEFKLRYVTPPLIDRGVAPVIHSVIVTISVAGA